MRNRHHLLTRPLVLAGLAHGDLAVGVLPEREERLLAATPPNRLPISSRYARPRRRPGSRRPRTRLAPAHRGTAARRPSRTAHLARGVHRASPVRRSARDP